MKSDKYQFIVWGHRHDRNPFKHIHEAFFRALQHQGRRVRWIDEDDGGDFDNAIFLGHGIAAHDIPLRKDAFYLIHNYLDSPVQGRFDDYNWMHYGVKVDSSGPPVDRVLDIIWATDLLPHEIEANKDKAQLINESSRVINWVGSVIKTGEFSNYDAIQGFVGAARELGVGFSRHSGVSIEDNVRLIQESYLAPALVGNWQERVGYIPCRIFKNISYGHFGVTNSKRVNELFNNKLIYHGDTRQLFWDARKTFSFESIAEGYVKVSELFDLMDYVAANHTYINRIDQLLNHAEKLL
jgi:hypothetical protein